MIAWLFGKQPLYDIIILLFLEVMWLFIGLIRCFYEGEMHEDIAVGCKAGYDAFINWNVFIIVIIGFEPIQYFSHSLELCIGWDHVVCLDSTKLSY